MLRFLLTASVCFLLLGCANVRTASPQRIVITEDIPRFWTAYDAIRAEPDPLEKNKLLSALYIDAGTPGLHAMNRARSYQSSEYLTAIERYPNYLDAVRANTLNADALQAPLTEGMREISELYPDGEIVPIYLVIGAFRASGTANDGKMLFGAELALAESGMPTAEFEEPMPHLVDFIRGGPLEGIVPLALHEYIHAQQRSIGGNDLLSQALFEGVAEYLSTAALGKASEQPAIAYGEENREAVLDAFLRDIALEDYSGWIWNSADNEFGTRDLGYYVGYTITEAFIAASDDRSDAIKTLIELDYLDRDAVEAVVDASGVLPSPVSSYR